MDTLPYLEEMFSRTLAATEKPTPEKLLLLLERWQGCSAQLPAHEGVDDAVYGSLAVYRQEIAAELAQYAANHSIAALEDAVSAAIRRSDDPAGAALAWEAIREYTCP